MISHEYRFIFIHIPKCAGTSVEDYFGHLDDSSGRGAQDHRPMRVLQTPIPLRHALSTAENRLCLVRRAYHACRQHTNPRNKRTVTAAQYAEYYKFTIIRDPWSRLYSWYCNVVRDPIHLQNYRIDSSIDFSTFLDRFGGRGMLAPIDFWLKEFDGQVRLDRIIDFNEIATAFPEICHRLGIADGRLPFKNTGASSSSLHAVYDQKLKKKIEEIYGEEIARYRFSFPV